MNILIDPGHGGKDPGAQGNGLQEKSLTLKIGQKAADLLRSKGLSVELTRNTDTYIGLADRIRPCDLSISVHVNAGGGQGLETWIALYNKPQASQKLGRLIPENILLRVPFKDRGLKTKKNSTGNQDYLYMIRMAMGVPVLIECGFIDNSVDAAILKINKNLEGIAQGIAMGVIQYLGIEESRDMFKDVPKDHWAKDSIERLAKLEIIKGDGKGNFRPNAPLTRAEAAVILDRALRYLQRQ